MASQPTVAAVAAESNFCRAGLVKTSSVTTSAHPPKSPEPFADYLERRMKQHRAWQEAEIRRLCNDVLDEIGVAIPYRVRVTRPLPFDEAES